MAGTGAGKARTAAGRLETYRRKRRFERTSEPRGGERGAATRSVFVIHKHDASRAHYDFRLELDGVLLSWAVPKGPSLDPAVKWLAVQVEDHPLEYADFEGVIPADEYGGGTVMVWDRGEWQPSGDARKGYRDGHLSFSLVGTKLSGGWSLVRTGLDGGKKGHNWLLIKRKDRAAGRRDVLAEERSVAPMSAW